MAYSLPVSANPDDLQSELGSRLAKLRLARNITQQNLAADSGVGLRTLRRLEAGRPTSLDTFLRVAIALGLQEGLLAALPRNQIRPIERIDRRGKERRRARPGRAGVSSEPWTWGMKRMTDAAVNLWGRRIGAVSWIAERGIAVFQYEPGFRRAGIELSPFAMPVREDPFEFPEFRNNRAFNGLPGLLADSLPDRFGNILIDAWLAMSGRPSESFNPVERLCFAGARAVGALEFDPAIGPGGRSGRIRIDRLVDVANRVLSNRIESAGRLEGPDDKEALEDMLAVGTSAGGARAKAVLAWNPQTGEFRSGQVDAPPGLDHWILKFDGIEDSRDRGIADPQGYGRIEYAYHLMAREAGIAMSDCRLHQEGGRAHFMTRRFDRDGKGRKIHMQSLAALRHFDYNEAGLYSYEQVIQAIRALGLGIQAAEEQVRRAVFNVAARNQDDHVKNISFLMDRSGAWRLSPAYDVAYSYNPSGDWTGRHQMSLAGKQDGFERGDLVEFAKTSGIKPVRAAAILDRVLEAVRSWPKHAGEAGVPARDIQRIRNAHRVDELA